MGPTGCSCTVTYRSQQHTHTQKKGENPVTHDYYQLTHEIANHGAVMEARRRRRDRELFFSTRPRRKSAALLSLANNNNNGKHNSDVLRERARKRWSLQSFLSDTVLLSIHMHEIFMSHWEALPQTSISCSICVYDIQIRFSVFFLFCFFAAALRSWILTVCENHIRVQILFSPSPKPA